MIFIIPTKEYLSLYNEEQAHRHDMRPGLTGWAQINGCNTINWEDKLRYDVEYVINIYFMLDLKIFFLTIKKVFVREGINAFAEVTMEKFKGVVNSDYEHIVFDTVRF